MDRILVLAAHYVYAIHVVGTDMNYDGYQRVLRRVEETRRLADRILEVVENSSAPSAPIQEHHRALVQELAERLTRDEGDFEMRVSPI